MTDPRYNQPSITLELGWISRVTHIYVDNLPVRVLYGRVVGFYPLIVNELCCNSDHLVPAARSASRNRGIEMNL